jgi:hypothetical protein
MGMCGDLRTGKYVYISLSPGGHWGGSGARQSSVRGDIPPHGQHTFIPHAGCSSVNLDQQ